MAQTFRINLLIIFETRPLLGFLRIILAFKVGPDSPFSGLLTVAFLNRRILFLGLVCSGQFEVVGQNRYKGLKIPLSLPFLSSGLTTFLF